MKSQLFSYAISNRNQVKFLYYMNEIVLHPYYISREKSGRKVIYGRMPDSQVIRKYELGRIANLKIVNTMKFSPIIPLMSRVS